MVLVVFSHIAVVVGVVVSKNRQ